MRRTLNPLLLEHIVELVFNKLPSRELNNCSLVCKLWSVEAKRVKSKRQSIQVSSQGGITELLRKINVNGSSKIDKLHAESLNLDDPLFNTLLTSLEPTLSTLILEDGRVTLRTFHKLMRLLPNLVRLEIGILKTENGQYHSLFPVYDDTVPAKMVVFNRIESLEFISFNDPITHLSATIKTFPKLKRLTVFNLQIENLDNLSSITIPTLEELSIICFPGTFLSTEHLKMLLKIKLDSLKSLKLNNLKRDLSVLLIKEFIELQKDSLTNLELHQNEYVTTLNTAPSVNPFPLDLPNLTFLAVDKPFVRNLSHVCISLPKLKDIAFTFHKNADWMGILPKKMEKQMQVTGCTISLIEPQPLCMLSNMFPCVTRLIMHNCTDDILRTIYSSMPQLEILICFNLMDANVTQEGFTGIRSESLKELLDTSDAEVTKEVLDELRHLPAITALKKLKHIYLRFKENAISVPAILLYGLLDVQSLLTVALEDIEMSVDLIETLEEDFEYHVVEYKRPFVTSSSHWIIIGDIQDAFADHAKYAN